MKLTKGRVYRPISMTLCLLSAAFLVACGGGSATEESGPTETADKAGKNQSTQDVVVTQQQTTAPTTTITTTAPAPAPAQAPAPAPAPTTFSLELSWVAPQSNADGTALTDLAGYRILVGTASGNYSQIIAIDNPSTVNYTIPNLPAATYYVVVKAVDAANNESAPSSELVKVLR